MVNKIIINNSKKKKIKRLSANHYYASAFISNPCDQLFGPPLDCSLTNPDGLPQHTKDSIKSLNSSIDTSSSTTSCSITNSSINDTNLEDSKSSLLNVVGLNCDGGGGGNLENIEKLFVDVTTAHEKFEYIPTPKWNKMQTCILEELFKKSRYPKANELKLLSQRLNVMDTDVEEWFRKRRGRDRKTRRKNEALKSLIDNYLDK